MDRSSSAERSIGDEASRSRLRRHIAPRVMAHALMVLALAGPLVFASGWHARRSGEPAGLAWGAFVYAAASRVCHQRPERSFETRGTAWPVCARCSGLYLAAPIGAFLGWAGRRRLGNPAWRRLAVAAMPTAATIVLEWAGAPMSNALRAVAAAPAGAIAAWMVVATAASPRRRIK
jgi:uncharacterized membrane protein